MTQTAAQAASIHPRLLSTIEGMLSLVGNTKRRWFIKINLILKPKCETSLPDGTHPSWKTKSCIAQYITKYILKYGLFSTFRFHSEKAPHSHAV